MGGTGNLVAALIWKHLQTQRKQAGQLSPSLHPSRVPMAPLCHSSVTIRGPCKAASGERSNEGELVCDQVVRLETEQTVLGMGWWVHVGSTEPWKRVVLPASAMKDLQA